MSPSMAPSECNNYHLLPVVKGASTRRLPCPGPLSTSHPRNLMAEVRDVTLFPLAYSPEASYPNYFFPPDVQDFCRNLPLVVTQLRHCKCIFVGDISVGKTCLINRFGRNVFSNDYKTTIGVDFDVQRFNILNVPFNLQIWDTAGQERFRCITSAYYRSCHAAVIVFDMSNMSTLASVREWHRQIVESNCDSSPLIFLVATKKDLICDSVFNFVEREANKLASELRAEYWSVSSLSGSKVEDLFTRIAVLTFEQLIYREIEASRIERPITYSNNQFIKLEKEKRCKKFWDVLCKRS